MYTKHVGCLSQWPRGLRRRSAAARLLRSWVRIPPGAWRFVCCECCVLSGRGLCDELITRPEESYRLCCVVVCDLETSGMGAPYIYDIGRLRINVSVSKRYFLRFLFSVSFRIFSHTCGIFYYVVITHARNNLKVIQFKDFGTTKFN